MRRGDDRAAGPVEAGDDLPPPHRRGGPVRPSIVARSYFDVQWAAPLVDAADQTGDPVEDPVSLPLPLGTVGYLAQRGDGDLAAAVSIPRIIAAAPQPTPSDSPLLPAAAILRFADAGLPDPGTGYQHRTAGFGLFGQLGPYSDWGDPRGVERIAAAPALRLLTVGAAQTTFDNSPAGGGGPDDPANPTAWVGGTLKVIASWSANALLAYPSVRTARLSVTAVDDPSTVLAATDFTVPAAGVQAFTLTQLVPDPAAGVIYAVTDPPLAALGSTAPAASLTLTGVLDDGTAVTERFSVRPGLVDPAADVQPGGVVATLTGGKLSRVANNPAAFVGQPAYLVSGVSVPLTVRVPLRCRSGRAPHLARRAWPSRRRAHSSPASRSSTPNPHLSALAGPSRPPTTWCSPPPSS